MNIKREFIIDEFEDAKKSLRESAQSEGHGSVSLWCTMYSNISVILLMYKIKKIDDEFYTELCSYIMSKSESAYCVIYIYDVLADMNINKTVDYLKEWSNLDCTIDDFIEKKKQTLWIESILTQ